MDERNKEKIKPEIDLGICLGMVLSKLFNTDLIQTRYPAFSSLSLI